MRVFAKFLVLVVRLLKVCSLLRLAVSFFSAVIRYWFVLPGSSFGAHVLCGVAGFSRFLFVFLFAFCTSCARPLLNYAVSKQKKNYQIIINFTTNLFSYMWQMAWTHISIFSHIHVSNI